MRGSVYRHKKDLKRRIKQLAYRLLTDYEGKNPVFIGVLNGGFMFMADLLRVLSHPPKRFTPLYPEVDFIRVKSYQGTETTGTVTLVSDIDLDVAGRDVVLIEDIVDTGQTLEYLKTHFERHNVTSLRTVSLLVKESRATVSHSIEYIGFTVKHDFLIGYGLDINDKMRSINHLREIREL